MFSVVPNIVFAPNMTQNAERKHRTQDANTANFRSSCNASGVFFTLSNYFRRLQEQMCKKKKKAVKISYLFFNTVQR